MSNASLIFVYNDMDSIEHRSKLTTAQCSFINCKIDYMLHLSQLFIICFWVYLISICENNNNHL